MRVRTITAAAVLAAADDLENLEATAGFLGRARDRFTAAGHEVQTLRAATAPLSEYAPGRASGATTEVVMDPAS